MYQDLLISKIKLFLQQHNDDSEANDYEDKKKVIEHFGTTKGECEGLSTLWAYGKRIDEETLSNSNSTTPRDDTAFFYNIQQLLVEWDGKTQFNNVKENFLLTSQKLKSIFQDHKIISLYKTPHQITYFLLRNISDSNLLNFLLDDKVDTTAKEKMIYCFIDIIYGESSPFVARYIVQYCKSFIDTLSETNKLDRKIKILNELANKHLTSIPTNSSELKLLKLNEVLSILIEDENIGNTELAKKHLVNAAKI